MKITSNTIVKNGMPFIGKVLEQVAPYMDEMIISLSVKSTDTTRNELEKIREKYPDKVRLFAEDVPKLKDLTRTRNEQVQDSHGDWILFLDDDDFWPRPELEKCIAELDKDPDILAYHVNPFQLTEDKKYDMHWEHKFFSKWLRRDGLHFRKPWPKDMPFNKDRPLHWSCSEGLTKKLPYKFFHLSYLKEYTFRELEGIPPRYKFKMGRSLELPEEFKKYIDELF